MASADTNVALKFTVNGDELKFALFQVEKQIEKLNKTAVKSYDQMLKAADSYAVKLWKVNQAIEATKAAYDLFVSSVAKPMMAAAELQNLQNAFKGTKNDLEMLRQATAHTVDDSSLMKLSNQASDLGLTLIQQAKLFALAETKADDYGGSIAESFEKLVMATEGATKGLKQVGIQKAQYEETVTQLAKAEGKAVDDLDSEEKKRIGILAILQLTNTTMDDVIKKSQDNADKLEEMNKIQKDFEIAIGETISAALMPFVTHLTRLYYTFNEISPVIPGVAGTVAILGTALVALKQTGLMPLILDTNQLKVALGSMRAAIKLMATEVITFKDATYVAKVALGDLWKALGPIALAMGAVELISLGMEKFGKSTHDANESFKSGSAQIKEDSVRFEALTKIVEDNTKSMSARKNAVSEAQKLYPEYLANIDLEVASQAQLKQAHLDTTEAMLRQYRVKYAMEKNPDLMKKIVEAENSVNINEISEKVQKGLYDNNPNDQGMKIKYDNASTMLRQKKGELEKLRKELDDIMAKGIAPSNTYTPPTKDIKVETPHHDGYEERVVRAIHPASGKDTDWAKEYQVLLKEASKTKENYNNIQSVLKRKLKDTDDQKKFVEDTSKRVEGDLQTLKGKEREKASSLYFQLQKDLGKFDGGLLESIQNQSKMVEMLIRTAESESEIIEYKKKLVDLKEEEEALNARTDKAAKKMTVWDSFGDADEVKKLYEKSVTAEEAMKYYNFLLRIETNKAKLKEEIEELAGRSVDGRKADERKEDTFKADKASSLEKMRTSGFGENEIKQKELDLDYEYELKKYQGRAGFEEKIFLLQLDYQQKKRELNKEELRSKQEVLRSTLQGVVQATGEQTVIGKGAAIANATMSTYEAADKALTAGPILGPILAGVITAMGIANIAKIAGVDTKIKGFEKGGIITGERGPEIISPAQEYLSGFKDLGAILNMRLVNEFRLQRAILNSQNRVSMSPPPPTTVKHEFVVKGSNLVSAVTRSTQQRNKLAMGPMT